jgi:hypothetical protein
LGRLRKKKLEMVCHLKVLAVFQLPQLYRMGSDKKLHAHHEVYALIEFGLHLGLLGLACCSLINIR